MTKLDPKRRRGTGENILIDCTVNVCGLAHQMFSDFPKGKMSLKCTWGCPEKERELIDFLIPNKLLNDLASGDRLYNLLKESTGCDYGGCQGIVEKTFEASGKSLLQ